MKIDLYKQRSYQRRMREARAQGYRRFIRLWHRRAGKDRDTIQGFMIPEMLERVGVYFHLFPSLNQGRRDFWDNILKQKINGVEQSITIRDIFPKPLVASWNEAEMQIRLINDSIYQIMGADSEEAVERLRGPNPVGIAYSEFAHGIKTQKAQDTLAPVLAENGGWEAYIYTPNGLNHGYDLYEAALKQPKIWHVEKLTVDDTRRDAPGEDGSPVVSQEEIQSLRDRGVREEFIQQEFYCSFTGFEHGTIYGDLLRKAAENHQIRPIPFTVNAPVGAIIDLGKSDAIACWYYQKFGPTINFINYWEDTQSDLEKWVYYTRNICRYNIGRVVLPWDGWQSEVYLSNMGFRNIRVTDRTKSVQASIEEVRRSFNQFYFNEDKCGEGIAHLRAYSRKWDEDLRVFSPMPIHNQHSHAADALRVGVEGGFEPLYIESWQNTPLKVEMDFDPRFVER